MTPKEKAKELLSEYLIFFPEFRNDLEFDYNIESAKTCAFIAVDNILDAICFNMCDEEEWNKQNEYWEEVKQEILKL